MWLVIMLTGLVLAVANSVYFITHLNRAAAELIPGLPRAVRRGVSIAYLIVVGTLPALSLLFALYVLVFRPDPIPPRPGGPLFDILVTYPFWIAVVFSFQCTLYFVIFDLVTPLLRRWRGGNHWLRRKRVAVAAVTVGFALYFPFAIVADTTSLEVRSHELARADLPAELDGLEIALISDPQADQWTGPARLDQLVDAVRASKPDLVLIAGDLISRGPDYIELAAEHIGRLEAPLGVYSCVGDHDNFAYWGDHPRSVREITEALARRGVHMIDNEVRTLSVGGAEIAVAFVTNNYIERIERPALEELLARTKAADLSVAVVHQLGNTVDEAASRHGLDLVVAGHTHGGQVNVVYPLPITPVRAETPYLTGAHWLGDTLLVVSSGLGYSVAPFRYRAPATVDLITLRRR